MKILVVDDLSYNRRTLRSIFLHAGYDVVTAEDGVSALELARTEPPDLIVTDILMPRLDGFQLCRTVRTDPELQHIPVVFYTGSYVDSADRELGLSIGAVAYLTKPLEPRELTEAVAKVLKQPAPVLRPRSELGDRWASAYADRLAAKLQDKVAELHQAFVALDDTYTGTVEAFNLALSEREGTSPLDAERPAYLARIFCERVAPDLAADASVFRGFLLHDIGKLMLPDALLKKTAPLTDEERATLRRQLGVAADILRNVPGMGRALEIVRHHHEWWNGGGYPSGLAGEAIPLGARIFALADAFEAIVAGRPYRASRTSAEAVAEIRRQAGLQFDPTLVEPFVVMVQQMQSR